MGADSARLDASVRATIEAMESKRAKEEQALVKQACSEMASLTQIVLATLEQSLAARRAHKAGAAFLQLKRAGLSQEANIRLVSGFAFPKIADLIQEMQSKRDKAESKERRRILELESSLLEAENKMLAAALAA